MIYLTLLLMYHLIGPLFVLKIKVFNFTKEQKQKVFVVISFLILFLLSGLRSLDMGNDTKAYAEIFNSIKPFYFEKTRFEPGYMLLNHIIKLFTNNVHVFFLITSFIINLAMFKFFVKKSEITLLSLLLYLITSVYFGTFNTIRQYLALIFIIIAYDKFDQKKYLRFIIYVLIATTFHYSAIIVLGLFLSLLLTNRKKSYILIISVGILIIFTPMILIEQIPYYSSYLVGMFNNPFRPSAILSAITILSIIILGFFFRGDTKEITLLEKMTMISLFVSLLGVKTSVATRLNIYFYPFALVYLVNTIKLIKIKKEQVVVIIAIIIFFVLNYYVIAIYRDDWNHVIPYKFFFQNYYLKML